MSSVSVSPSLSLSEELAAIRWTDNVRPVDLDVGRRILHDAFLGIRVGLSPSGLAGSPSGHKRHRRGPRPRVPFGRDEVAQLSDRVIAACRMFATGASGPAIAKAVRVRTSDVGNLGRMLHQLHDLTPQDLRQFGRRVLAQGLDVTDAVIRGHLQRCGVPAEEDIELDPERLDLTCDPA